MNSTWLQYQQYCIKLLATRKHHGKYIIQTLMLICSQELC